MRNNIEGVGNLERFDYWLKSFQAFRFMGEFGCLRHDFERAMIDGDYQQALVYRTEMAQLFERLITLQVEKVTNVSDLGEIINLEILI